VLKRRAVQPSAAPVSVAEAPASVPSELELIKRAQAARGQPGAVLSALAEHERAYPTGMLAQEREVLAIEALVSAGRRGEAETRAKKLESAHPGSAHLRRVRVLLEPSASE
jgi:hypothetical protein